MSHPSEHDEGGLEFCEETHRYTLGGTWLPSVTQALHGLVDYSGLDPFYADRGSGVHRACQLAIQGRLVRTSLDPAVAGRVAAWDRMIAELQPRILENELRMGSREVGCAGTLDLVVEYQGKLWIWDIKSGDFGSETWGLQTAGYYLLYRATHGKIIVNRGVVRLKDDGSYKVITISVSDLVRDADVFRACVTVARWRGESHEI